MWVRRDTWSMPCQQARDTRHQLPSPDLPANKGSHDELRKLAARGKRQLPDCDWAKTKWLIDHAKPAPTLGCKLQFAETDRQTDE